MKRTARWWVGVLWLSALGWFLGTAPSPLQAAANTMQSASTRQVEPPAVTVRVTGTVVNLRAGPGLEHAVLGQVQQEDELSITGSSRDGQWLHLELDGESRWIYADLTDIDADVQWGLAVVTARPLTIEGEFDNQAEHWEGTYRLEPWGSTIGAVFATSRSPVQHYARQQPETLFILPPGFRPALDLDWEVEGWPVTRDGLPAADPAEPHVFTVRVSRDGTVRYVDNEQVEGIGYLRYTGRLAWPRAGTNPNVCERHFSIRRALVAILNMGNEKACARITWEHLATIKDLSPPSRYKGDEGFVEVRSAEDLAGLQGLKTAKISKTGYWPAGVLLPVPQLEILHVQSGSVALGAPFYPPSAVAPPEDLLAYTPRLEDLWLAAVSVENFRDGFLASVPRLRTLHIKNKNDNRLYFFDPLVWPDHIRLDTLLAPLPDLTDLYLDLGTHTRVPKDLLIPVPGLKTLTLVGRRTLAMPDHFPAGVPQLRQLTVQAPMQSVLPETFLAAAPQLESLSLYLTGYLPASFLAETPRLQQISLGLSRNDPFEWLLLFERLRKLNEDWLFSPSIRVGQYGQVSVGRQQLCAKWASRLTCWPRTGSPYTLTNRFQSVSAGDFHTCGVTQDHRIECWDLQGREQLEAPAGEFQSVAVGLSHNCGLRTDNAVVCWGDNAHGQTDAPPGPYQAVTAGLHHSCGLRTDGTIVCWGDNRKGQTDALSGQFGEVSAGGHFSCALDVNQYQLQCWGDNSVGQTDLSEMRKIGKRIEALDAGFDHACAVFVDLGVRCWGGNEYGQLVGPTGDFQSVSAGYKASCALTDGGTRICWGWPGHPQIQVAGEIGTSPYGLDTTGTPLTTYRFVAGKPALVSGAEATGPAPGACPEQGPSPSLACDRELLLAIQDGLRLRIHSKAEARELWATYAPVQDFKGVLLSGDPPRVTGVSLSGPFKLTTADGKLTAALGRLTHLRHLEFSHLQITGSIPSALGQLANLEVLDLTNNQLTGSIPPELGQLASLAELNLVQNQLSGAIPTELGQLTGLKQLGLAHNQLTGPIPPELGQLIHLPTLSLYDNRLTGPIPPALGQLAGLEVLELARNQLTDSIPPALGQLSSLYKLNLAHNQLSGAIPPELGQLPRLHNLHLAHNQLSAIIPPELGQLPRLEVLNIEHNQLAGSIQPALGQLPRLRNLNLAHNRLSGVIPPELGQLPRLEVLNVEHNQLAGSIQPALGQLPRLRNLNLAYNRLSGVIPPELGQLPRLEVLNIEHNQLTGSIQPALGDFPRLRNLNLAHNRLDNTVLRDLSQLTGLSVLNLAGNQLTGPIPPELVQPRLLRKLQLADNQLTGPIPPQLGQLIWLRELDLAGNSIAGCLPPEVHAKCDTCADLPVCPALDVAVCPDQGPSPSLTCDKEILLELKDTLWGSTVDGLYRWQADTPLAAFDGVTLGGEPPRVIELHLGIEGVLFRTPPLGGTIPPALARISWLQKLHLQTDPEYRWGISETTLLTGPIPPHLGQLALLEELVVLSNKLTGPIPPQLGQLTHLRQLSLPDNQLIGPIPPQLGQLPLLVRLDLSDNQLTGHIPPKLGQLADLEHLDLSANQLSSPIPSELEQLDQLKHLDLSANELTGPIPLDLVVLPLLDTLDLRDNAITGCLHPSWRSKKPNIYTDLGEAAYCED